MEEHIAVFVLDLSPAQPQLIILTGTCRLQTNR